MLDLLDYRRRVSEMYRYLRQYGDDPKSSVWFQRQRDDLFAHHPQSPLSDEQRAHFRGLVYYPYRRAYRVTTPLEWDVEPGILELDLGDEGVMRLQRFGRVRFDVPTGAGVLYVYWVLGYGGGLFLPFKDLTHQTETYGGGRYLYDTIKGVDLGATMTDITLDFNYAYNPSCAYHPRWVCPLAPPENTLNFSIPAGELNFTG